VVVEAVVQGALAITDTSSKADIKALKWALEIAEEALEVVDQFFDALEEAEEKESEEGEDEKEGGEEGTRKSPATFSRWPDPRTTLRQAAASPEHRPRGGRFFVRQHRRVGNACGNRGGDSPSRHLAISPSRHLAISPS
jgi:hypothetical protein